MQVQHLGQIEIHKVTELPGLAMKADALMPGITSDILADGRLWLSGNFVHPSDGIVYLSFHSYVVKTPRHNILVDTCCGNQKPRESMPSWHMLDTPYLSELAAAGLQPEEIDIVLCTHLHADHVGWNTRLIDGHWVPTFPNARYIMGKEEFEHWQMRQASDPATPVNRGAHADSVLPVVERGMALMVPSNFAVEVELGEGVWLEPSPGHSPGHVSVHVKAGGKHALLSGDAIHHPLQLKHPHLPIAADFDRGQAQATRRDILETYADTETLLLTAHFPSPTAGRIVSRAQNFGFDFIQH